MSPGHGRREERHKEEHDAQEQSPLKFKTGQLASQKRRAGNEFFMTASTRITISCAARVHSSYPRMKFVSVILTSRGCRFVTHSTCTLEFEISTLVLAKQIGGLPLQGHQFPTKRGSGCAQTMLPQHSCSIIPSCWRLPPLDAPIQPVSWAVILENDPRRWEDWG